VESSRKRPEVNLSLLLLRLVAGLIMVGHGAKKLFGAFGGQGLAPLVAQFGALGYLVAIGEFFGGLGMMLGFLTRFSAAANIVIMLGAIFLVHGRHGFFLGAPESSGFEYNLALIALFAPLLLNGPGDYSLARLFKLDRYKPLE
jgi:putative oxidoreductase